MLVQRLFRGLLFLETEVFVIHLEVFSSIHFPLLLISGLKFFGSNFYAFPQTFLQARVR